MKKALSISTGFAGFLSLASRAFAAPTPTSNTGGQALPGQISACPQNGGFGALCNFSGNNLGTVLGNIITIVFIVAVLIALAFLIFGGIRWILSGGEKEKVDESRKMIMAAVVGLIVVFLSYFILNIVISFFIPGFSINNIQIPQIFPQG